MLAAISDETLISGAIWNIEIYSDFEMADE
jgi:hypothetical protein